MSDEVPNTMRYGRGCQACKQTGYKGRTAIHEFLPVSDAIQPLILRRATSQEITQLSQRTVKMRTLRADGWRKIQQGITTPDEVLRVT